MDGITADTHLVRGKDRITHVKLLASCLMHLIPQRPLAERSRFVPSVEPGAKESLRESLFLLFPHFLIFLSPLAFNLCHLNTLSYPPQAHADPTKK